MKHIYILFLCIVISIANLVILKDTSAKDRLQLCTLKLDDLRCLYPKNITLYNNISKVVSFSVDKSKQNFVINTISEDNEYFDVYVVNSDYHMIKHMTFNFVINVAMYGNTPIGIVYVGDIIPRIPILKYFNESDSVVYNLTNLAFDFEYDIYENYYYVSILRPVSCILKVNIDDGKANMISIDQRIIKMSYNPGNKLMYVVFQDIHQKTLSNINMVTGIAKHLTVIWDSFVNTCGWNNDNSVLYCSLYDNIWSDNAHTLMSYNIETNETSYTRYGFNIYGIYSE